MNNDASAIRAGLRIVTIGLIVLMVLAALDLLGGLLTRGGLTPIVRFALTAWICWSVYSGKVWARLILAFLLVVGGVMTVLSAFGGGDFAPFLGLIGILDIAGAVGLFVIPQVNAYLEYAAAQTQ